MTDRRKELPSISSTTGREEVGDFHVRGRPHSLDGELSRECL